MRFPGFLKVYPTSTKDELLPEMNEKEIVTPINIASAQKFTQPPARYSEASLVKVLEEKGIGRPSTYAPTIATVVDRGYVEKIDDRRLKPTDIAFVVNDLLVTHFSEIVDYDFTAKMENDLDEVAENHLKWQSVIKEFYEPFNIKLMAKEKEINRKDTTETATDEICEKCKSPMVIKVGRFGKFLACSNFPECKNTKKIGADNKPQEHQEPQLLEEKCPDCGSPLAIRLGRFGKFTGCSSYPKCKYIKKEAPKEITLPCPKCGGQIVPKRSKRGFFYGCSNYPNCDWATWNKPNGEKCPKCSHPIAEDKNGIIKCTNKDCV